MPLVLSLRSGDDFYLNDSQLVIGSIRGADSFDVRMAGKTYEITNAEAVEIMEDVFLSAGSDPMPKRARVAIDAPREVTILRGPRYRGEVAAKEQANEPEEAEEMEAVVTRTNKRFRWQ